MSTQDMTDFTDRAGTGEGDVDEDKLQNRRVIAFGMDMDHFLTSQVGRYLEARAQLEIRTFREQLDDLDPSDEKAIRDLQQEIAARKMWKDWLQLAIQEGKAAESIAIERNEL